MEGGNKTQVSKNQSTKTANDVLLYIPNIIGYIRIIFAISAYFLMIFYPSKYILAIVLYILSFIGDLFDGIAARKLNQVSAYGGLLDMITDRCATTGLLYILSGEYTDHLYAEVFRFIYLFLILLDISSHWCQMYSTSSLNLHHKSTAANSNRFFLVNYYYKVYYFFGYCCVGTEVTYICLYLLCHLHDDGKNNNENIFLLQLCQIVLAVCMPACVVKQIVNIAQLSSACYAVAENDANTKIN